MLGRPEQIDTGRQSVVERLWIVCVVYEYFEMRLMSRREPQMRTPSLSIW